MSLVSSSLYARSVAESMAFWRSWRITGHMVGSLAGPLGVGVGDVEGEVEDEEEVVLPVEVSESVQRVMHWHGLRI